jgi:hypothetical protein
MGRERREKGRDGGKRKNRKGFGGRNIGLCERRRKSK